MPVPYREASLFLSSQALETEGWAKRHTAALFLLSSQPGHEVSDAGNTWQRDNLRPQKRVKDFSTSWNIWWEPQSWGIGALWKCGSKGVYKGRKPWSRSPGASFQRLLLAFPKQGNHQWKWWCHHITIPVWIRKHKAIVVSISNWSTQGSEEEWDIYNISKHHHYHQIITY